MRRMERRLASALPRTRLAQTPISPQRRPDLASDQLKWVGTAIDVALVEDVQPFKTSNWRKLLDAETTPVRASMMTFNIRRSSSSTSIKTVLYP